MKSIFFLEREEIAKVANFFQKEFGITNINGIKATVNSFEISRLCFEKEDSLAIKMEDEVSSRSIQNFKKFAENYKRAID